MLIHHLVDKLGVIILFIINGVLFAISAALSATYSELKNNSGRSRPEKLYFPVYRLIHLKRTKMAFI